MCDKNEGEATIINKIGARRMFFFYKLRVNDKNTEMQNIYQRIYIERKTRKA